MKRAEALARARKCISQPIEYRLGKGGMHPENALPCDKENCCDCSGFVCWALGFSRWATAPKGGVKHFISDWVSTSSIFADALKSRTVFERVQSPEPGDLIVYPDSSEKRQGHVGIVGSVFEGEASSVIHCSNGNWKPDGYAVKETPLAPFWAAHGAIFARPLIYEAEPSVGAEGDA